jgi:hypothetical protein
MHGSLSKAVAFAVAPSSVHNKHRAMLTHDSITADLTDITVLIYVVLGVVGLWAIFKPVAG